MRAFKIAGVVLLGTMLSGCFVSFDPRGCPTERKYTKAEQAAFLRDFPRTPPVVQGFIADYGILRDKVRACRGDL